MNRPDVMRPGDWFARWATAQYPEYPHVYAGRSGATLLFHALRDTRRRAIILPAFICPELPEMARQAGLQVIHVDVNRTTMQMDDARLADCLARLPEAETVLLVDHPFGYPATGIGRTREQYPDLLIVEDCVRALGSQVGGAQVGRSGDWVLLSMYKATPGNQDGAVLLTRSPCSMPAWPAARASVGHWASGCRPLYAAYERVKRYRPGFTPAVRDLPAPDWSPRPGSPSPLCWRRFERQLRTLDEDRRRRAHAATAIAEALDEVPGLRVMDSADGTDTSAFFLSFTVSGNGRRDALVTTLHRQGLFLVWAWNSVPAWYRVFADTFPYGHDGSRYLADHVCHVPVSRYVSPARRARLVAGLRSALGSPAAARMDRDG